MTAVEIIKNEIMNAFPMSDGRLDFVTIRRLIIHKVASCQELTRDGIINEAIAELVRERKIEERSEKLYYL